MQTTHQPWHPFAPDLQQARNQELNWRNLRYCADRLKHHWGRWPPYQAQSTAQTSPWNLGRARANQGDLTLVRAMPSSSRPKPERTVHSARFLPHGWHGAPPALQQFPPARKRRDYSTSWRDPIVLRAPRTLESDSQTAVERLRTPHRFPARRADLPPCVAPRDVARAESPSAMVRTRHQSA